MTTPTQTEIRRTIDIAAPLERVWALVSEPGWWINDGALVAHTIEYDESGTECVVTDPKHGTFRLGLVASRQPSFVAFRWHPTGPGDASTLTEFTLEETGDVVRVTVVESDYDSLPPEKLADFLRDNTEGWEIELEALRRALTSPS